MLSGGTDLVYFYFAFNTPPSPKDLFFPWKSVVILGHLQALTLGNPILGTEHVGATPQNAWKATFLDPAVLCTSGTSKHEWIPPSE